MSAPINNLAEALIAALATQGKTVVRSYLTLEKTRDLQNGKWLALVSTENVTKKRRVDSVKSSIAVVYQRQLPSSTSLIENPLENNTFLDSCMNEVESVKSMFREDGPLADVALNDTWVFESMTNSPIYVPNHLLENQVFTSPLMLEFLTLQG